MGLISRVESVERALGSLRGWSFFFVSMLEAIFFALGAILGRFWEPKWKPKSSFCGFFFDVFFESVFASIFGCFREARNPENMHGA